jgi:hypothetical protein
MAVPETRYAQRSDGVNIGYQVLGSGPTTLVWSWGWMSRDPPVVSARCPTAESAQRATNAAAASADHEPARFALRACGRI